MVLGKACGIVKPNSSRPSNPEQTLLLPLSPVDWLPENPLIFFLPNLVAELDLEATYAFPGRRARGVRRRMTQE
jgi:hypothetical protein